MNGKTYETEITGNKSMGYEWAIRIYPGDGILAEIVEMGEADTQKEW